MNRVISLKYEASWEQRNSLYPFTIISSNWTLKFLFYCKKNEIQKTHSSSIRSRGCHPHALKNIWNVVEVLLCRFSYNSHLLLIDREWITLKNVSIDKIINDVPVSCIGRLALIIIINNFCFVCIDNKFQSIL